MAVTAQLYFGLGVPIITTDGKGWWLGMIAGLPDMVASRAVTFLAVDVCGQSLDALIDDLAGGGVAIDATTHHFALMHVAEAIGGRVRCSIPLARREPQSVAVAKP